MLISELFAKTFISKLCYFKYTRIQSLHPSELYKNVEATRAPCSVLRAPCSVLRALLSVFY